MIILKIYDVVAVKYLKITAKSTSQKPTALSLICELGYRDLYPIAANEGRVRVGGGVTDLIHPL
jgi:hypothetical protein